VLTSGQAGPSFTGVGQRNTDEEIVMKNFLSLTVCALTLLAFASTAQSDGGDASGTFAFDLGTATGTVNFFGHLAHKDDPASGQISLHATIGVSNEVCWHPSEEDPRYVCEPIGDDTGGGLPPETVVLDFPIDRMVLVNNRAAMSGTINDNSAFNGLHTILAVENASGGDGFTWGVYKTKIFRNDGDPEPHLVSLTGLDYDFCPPPPPNDCEFECGPPPPPPACIFDGLVINDQNVLGPTLTAAASDYDLCPYPPPSDTLNYPEIPNVDLHNYTCFNNAAPSPNDPRAQLAGIPILATQAITNALSFPLFTYPMTPIPHGGGNKVSVKPNG
jgi:hypothetical protein